MPINPDAVGTKTGPFERSWDSKDCLLYALGVGAGAIDPTGFELEFTTENSMNVEQKVLPTFAVTIGMGFVANIGSFNMAMLLHGEQGIELHRPIPVDGKGLLTSECIGIYDKGKGAVAVTESVLVDKQTEEKLLTTRSSMFVRGEGGWGGDRGPFRKPQHPTRPHSRPRSLLPNQTRPNPALPSFRRPKPLALRSRVRKTRRIRKPHPSRPLHLWFHRTCPAPHTLRLKPRQLYLNGRPVRETRHAWRHPHRANVGRR